MKQSRSLAALTVLLAGTLLTSCGGGGGGAYGGTSTPTAAGNTADPGATVVGILGDRGAQSFAPNPVTAKVGQKVAWRNQDGIVHRIVQDTPGGNTNDGSGYGPGSSVPDGVFDGGETAPGAMSSAMSLGSAGTVRYHCMIHPSMVGSIVVQ